LADRQKLVQSARSLDASYNACASSPGATERELFGLRNQHMDFHLELAAGTRCPLLYEAIEKNQILIFNWFFDQLFGYPGLPNNWHGELAEALERNDSDAGDRAMRKHVRFRMDELLVRLEPYFNLNSSVWISFSKMRAGPATQLQALLTMPDSDSLLVMRILKTSPLQSIGHVLCLVPCAPTRCRRGGRRGSSQGICRGADYRWHWQAGHGKGDAAGKKRADRRSGSIGESACRDATD
jgi:hypothetical protein